MPSLIFAYFKRSQSAAICALVSFFCAMPIVQAAPNSEQIAAYESAPETDRVNLLLHLARSGQAEDAAFMLKKYPLTGPYAANRTLYIEGLIQKANGDLTGAAKTFRKVLANDPNLTLVRADLAQVLVALEEDDSAKHHLELLASEAPDEAAASGIRSFIEKVDSRRPYTASGYVSFVPSTNVNNGSKHTTVYTPGTVSAGLGSVGDISEENQEKSGLGVAGGANVGYTKRLGNDFSFVAAGGADVRIYDNFDFNSYSLSQSVEVRRMVDMGYFGIGAVASELLEDDKLGVSFLSYGPRVSTSLHLTGKDHLSASAVYEWRNSFETGSYDSTALMFDASLTHGFSSSFTTTLFGGWDKIVSGSSVQSYRSISGGLSIYKELSHGITATLTGQMSDSNFEGYSLFFATRRKDTRMSGSISLTKRDLNFYGFAPSLYYGYTENHSNINLYDFNSHAVDFRLTKDF
jgi:outer membrane protein